MPHPAWLDCVQWMSRHHGLATRPQLHELGISARTLDRRVADGLLVPVFARVVALPGIPLDLAALTRACVLALPSAIPTGPSAAALLGHGPWEGLDLGSEPWLVHPRSRSVPVHFVKHREIKTTWAQGVRVAAPAGAVVDLARHWPYEDALVVVQRALQQRLLSLDQLTAAHAAAPRQSGAGQLARVIRALAEGARSEAERLLIRILRDARVTGWAVNLRVRAAGRTYELDVAFPQARLAVEVDGRAFHSDPRAFQRDRQRQNDLVSEGWTVLRFTWADLTQRPEVVVERILRQLAAAVA